MTDFNTTKPEECRGCGSTYVNLVRVEERGRKLYCIECVDRMSRGKFEQKIKEGDMVTCILVTGEKAVGTYSCTKETTGSHLIENVTTENGQKAAFAWAKEITSR